MLSSKSCLVPALCFFVGCTQSDPEPTPSPTRDQGEERGEKSAKTPAPPKKAEFVAAEEGEVQALVHRALEEASAQDRQLLVYVGATWCEPCRYFHEALDRGELDAIFPRLRLLEFDADSDRERLREAGYGSRMIPLFALPDASGRASGRRFEGSIKGPGAVDNIVPRLRALLRSASSD